MEKRGDAQCLAIRSNFKNYLPGTGGALVRPTCAPRYTQGSVEASDYPGGALLAHPYQCSNGQEIDGCGPAAGIGKTSRESAPHGQSDEYGEPRDEFRAAAGRN